MTNGDRGSFIQVSGENQKILRKTCYIRDIKDKVRQSFMQISSKCCSK